MRQWQSRWCHYFYTLEGIKKGNSIPNQQGTTCLWFISYNRFISVMKSPMCIKKKAQFQMTLTLSFKYVDKYRLFSPAFPLSHTLLIQGAVLTTALTSVRPLQSIRCHGSMMMEGDRRPVGTLRQKHSQLSHAVPGWCGGGAQSSTAPCPSLTNTDSLSSDEKRSRSERGGDRNQLWDGLESFSGSTVVPIWASPRANFYKTNTKRCIKCTCVLNWAVVYTHTQIH